MNNQNAIRVTLEEIKKVVEENHDKTVDFINVPDAQQYRESVMIRKKKNNESILTS